jgi:hypothetical protein
LACLITPKWRSLTLRFGTSASLDDDASFEFRDVREGEVIAEGTTRSGGYGDTPLDRIHDVDHENLARTVIACQSTWSTPRRRFVVSIA